MEKSWIDEKWQEEAKQLSADELEMMTALREELFEKFKNGLPPLTEKELQIFLKKNRDSLTKEELDIVARIYGYGMLALLDMIREDYEDASGGMRLFASALYAFSLENLPDIAEYMQTVRK